MGYLEKITPVVTNFIMEHLHDDVSSLALKGHRDSDFPMAFVLNQISSRQKLLNKFSDWARHPDLVFPKSIAAEQCSSDVTANYKASLFSGDTFVDLTGGLGVDCYFLSKKFNKGVYVEPDHSKLECVQYNFRKLGVHNVEFVHSTAEDYLNSNSKHFNLIYIDPSRRVDSGKVITLENSVPDVTTLDLSSRADHVLIKTSPVLDIAMATRSLKEIIGIYTLSVKNDCKEVLYVLSKIKVEETKRVAINFQPNELESYVLCGHMNSNPKYSAPLYYLYEPNASVLKMGLFNEVCDSFDVFKLHPNSHLYTSEKLVPDFPGRKFQIMGTAVYQKKEVRKYVLQGKANITVRNFPDSVETIKKKLKIKDGGNNYLFATTLKNENKVIIVCEKLRKD